jgi:lipoprotein-anchoring transpeptidase ErfK/SrfK
VTVTATIGGRQLRHDRLAVHRSPGGTYGWFTETLTSPTAGQVQIAVRHAQSAALARATAATSFAALDDTAGFGSTGRFVQLIQQRLAALHFYIPQTGVYDAGTGWAIDAYHRLLHWGTSQTLDRNTVIWLLNGWGAFHVRYPGDGRHAEGNLSLQLLALIDHGQVQAIYPISSGKPSTPTILGRFHVQRKIPFYRPDGMYFSSYFSGGYAIHGFNPAPDYPASHGCMRVPIADAVSIYNWIRIGDGVDTYY